jgi:hypothetical protein
MRLHLQALYTLDHLGRLVAVKATSALPAPRFFLGRTLDGPVVAVGHEVPESMVDELVAIASDVPPGMDAHSPLASILHSATTLLSAQQPLVKTWAGPNYRCPPELAWTGEATPITPSNASLLSPYLEPWLEDVAERVPMAAVLVGGRAVSVCCSVRISAAADEAGVDTHLDFRGRGHALAAVAAWSQAVSSVGRVPLYSTSWENRASQRVAEKLGLMQYGSVLHVT